MKKKIKKLTLNRETLHYLGNVSGGYSENESMCGYTCARQCQLVPSVDGCGTNIIACASEGFNYCNSAWCDSLIGC
jgi:hypothetical protein